MSDTLICEDCPNPAELNRVRCAECLAKRRVIEARIRENNGVRVGRPGRPRSTDAKPRSVRARQYREQKQAAAGVPTWAQSLTSRLESLGYSEGLGETWMAATRRHARHNVFAVAAPGCLQIREPFEVFAREVVEAPNDAVRLSILLPEPVREIQPPFQQYLQYVPPVMAAA